MLQEENENILDKVSCYYFLCKSGVLSNCFSSILVYTHIKLIVKCGFQLRVAEERREEADARARELEKQVSCCYNSYVMITEF